MSKGKPQSAAIYARISEDPRDQQAGVKRQEEDCQALAEKRGWGVGEVYIDNDISAYSGKVRPAYERMLADIERGVVDGVIVWHVDRLHRRMLDLENFLTAVEKAGIAQNLASVFGDYDLSSPDSRAMLRVMVTMAQKESDDKRRRIRRKHVELAASGRALGGVTTPYGYVYDPSTKIMLPHPEQAPVVRAIFERFLAGVTLGQIARDLEDGGVVGQRGKTMWPSSHVARILDNPTHAGWRHFQGELTRGQWEPLVSPEIWEKAQVRRLASKAEAPKYNRKGIGKNLLSGVLFCECGEPMYRSSYQRGDHDRSEYLCSRSQRKRWGDCTKGGVRAPRAEGIVVESFLERFSEPFGERASSTTMKSNGKANGFADRISKVDRQIEKLIAASLEDIGPDIRKATKKKLAALQEERAALGRDAARYEVEHAAYYEQVRRIENLQRIRKDLRSVWNLADTAERNEMLRAGVERATVSGTRPKDIAIEWRG